MIGIDIERSRLLEWSVVLNGWNLLYTSGELADPALCMALPIELLIHSASVDDAVARALLAKNNAVLAENRAEGKREGRAEAVVELLVLRGVALDPDARARILTEDDPERLGRWFSRAVTCASLAELFAEP